MSKIEKLEELLTFKRIHKSYLINSNSISEFKKGKKASVTLINGEILPVSKSKKSILTGSVLA